MAIPLILVAFVDSKSLAMIAFVTAIFFIGILEERKSLMIVDFISDALPASERMHLSYAQKAIGGAATIAIVLLLHYFM